MKKVKKLMALVIAAVMILAMTLPAMAEEPATPAWAGKVDTSISINGLNKDDSVAFYQVLAYDQNASAKVEDATSASTGAGSWKAVAPFAEMTLADFKAILTTGITAEIAGRIGSMATGTATYTVTANANGVASQSAPAAGLYVAIITPAAGTDTTYNPVFVGADYYTNTSNGWAVTAELTYADNAMAKKSTVTLEKSAKASESIDANSKETVSVGDKITFTVEATIPGFADNYTNPVFKLTDKLSDGLTLDVDTVTVTAPTGLTKGTEYTVVPTEAGEGDDAVVDGYVLAFTADYLKTVKTATEVTVTYNAEVNSAALDNVNPEDNTVTLNYSTYPTDEEGHGVKKDKTNHYSFDIDANLFGEENYNATEVVKVGVDKEGNEITQTIQLANGHWVGALAGAKFKLYKANSEGEKGDLYTNKYLTTDSVIISDENGRLKVQNADKQGIRGLDAGVYFLEETDAPAGYIKLQDPVKIEIKAVIQEKSYEEVIEGITVTYKANELVSYSVEIGGTETANYTMQNAEDGTHPHIRTNEGDTVVGGTDSEQGKPSTDKTGKLQNTQGVELPSTGGIGTTIFYVVGAILVIGAGVVLVTKRRMNK